MCQRIKMEYHGNLGNHFSEEIMPRGAGAGRGRTFIKRTEEDIHWLFQDVVFLQAFAVDRGFALSSLVQKVNVL